MLQSPLHLLIFLRRILLRTKLRHRSSYHPHLLFRPITKTASWSATISCKIPSTSLPPTFSKSISSFGKQQHQQINRLPSATPSSFTRRLILNRRPHSKANLICFQQHRTMVSSGNGGHNAVNQINTVLNPGHYFTSQYPLLGVHGGGSLHPAPPGSFRSYNTKQPWAYQQQQQQSSSENDDTNGVDDTDGHDYFCYKSSTHLSKNNLNKVGTSTNTRQQVYRPPNMRGMADLMEDNNGVSTRTSNKNDNDTQSSENGKKHYHPGLVHRGQPPRKSSPLLRQPHSSSATAAGGATSPIPIGPVLRHDDLSLQTTKKRPSSFVTAINDDNTMSTQQWYISIPMDLSFLLLSEETTNTPPPPSTEGYFYMSRPVSVLDSTWLASFHSWSIRLRTHLAKVMMLIQLIGIEAQRYHTNDKGMDFKMIMTRSDTGTELCIFLPHQLCAPEPDTPHHLQQWVGRLMKEPPHFEIKCQSGDAPTPPTATAAATTTTKQNVDDDDEEEEDDNDLVIVSKPEDDEKGQIGPRYFKDIHVFLNHVDSMIESTPAFTRGDGAQRRFSL